MRTAIAMTLLLVCFATLWAGVTLQIEPLCWFGAFWAVATLAVMLEEI